MTELHAMYSENWYDLDGRHIPVDSIVLQVCPAKDPELNCVDYFDVFFYISFDDLRETSLTQEIACSMTESEVKAVITFAREVFDLDVAVICSQ